MELDFSCSDHLLSFQNQLGGFFTYDVISTFGVIFWPEGKFPT